MAFSFIKSQFETSKNPIAIIAAITATTAKTGAHKAPILIPKAPATIERLANKDIAPPINS